MIVELVEFRQPAGWERERILADAKTTVAKWTANKDLVRKHFVMGLRDDAGVGAGIYIWPSMEAAQKAHDAQWRAAIEKRTGSTPTIRYFDLFLLIDNEHDAVTEWAADGTARELATA